MKIGLISVPHHITSPNSDAYGGIELFTGGLAQLYDKLGHEVHLFAAEGSYEPPHGELHAVLKPEDKSMKHEDYVPRNFELYMDNEHHRKTLLDVDILHDHSLNHPGKALKMNGLRQNYMMTDHCHIPDDNLVYHLLCRVAVSFSHAIFMENQAGTKWRTVYNGVAVNDKQFNPKDREDRLLFFSRMYYSKGADRAIQIAEAAKIPIDIVGGDSQPAELKFAKHVEGLCKKSKYAKYIGRVDNKTKAEYFRNAKAVVLPVRTIFSDPDVMQGRPQYWQEPGCVIPLEANVCGTPIIAPPNGALAEYIQNGYTGFFANTKEEFVDSISKVDSLDKKYLRDYVVKHFSIERVASDYISLYEKVIKGEEW